MRRNPVGRDGWLAIVVAVAAIGLVVYLIVRPAGENSGPAATSSAGQNTTSSLANLARRTSGDPLAQGVVGAPVVLVIYSDYRCPFCAKFSREHEPALVKQYVGDGTLRIEWRDLPIFGEPSMLAARAGRAAAAQGKFWEFNHAVYAEAPAKGHPDLTPEVLREFARKAGVPDLGRFATDLGGTAFDEQIGRDAAEAQSLGFTGTPAFMINGRPIVGAQPVQRFQEIIEAAKSRP
ncbi:DsbA family protein [Crossiella sp. CA198]|uniref:DsbA family protein n=1 Tax=Crossiella sp. CA198 TaxID=3455607 RepID=UPI003F8D5F51